MGNKQQNKTNILIGGDSPTEKKNRLYLIQPPQKLWEN
jgi:hypothetical protein